MVLKEATIQAYQQLTGATLINIRIPTRSELETTTSMDQIGPATVADNQKAETNKERHIRLHLYGTNPETMVKTEFSISSVPIAVIGGKQDKMEDIEAATVSQYHPLEINTSLPDFLQEETEFESTQLPQLLQNVLCAIFPEEDEAR